MKEYREPWEIIGIIISGYLGVLLWHSTITVIDYGVSIMKYREELDLINCIEVPFLL